MPRDLTGYWTADDGGAYYLFMSDPYVWWLGLDDNGSLHKGTAFTNVFLGSISPPGTPPQLTGQWADVPRGQTMTFGNLVLSINDGQDPMTLTKAGGSDGFGASTWTFQSQSVDRTFSGMNELFGKIIKNSWHTDWYNPSDWFSPARETLASNLNPVKDSVVVYGTFQTGESVPDYPFIDSFPPDQAPSWDVFKDLNNRWTTADFNADSRDGDLSCHITVVPEGLPADLYDGMTDYDKSLVQNMLGPTIHPEVVMFAREEDGSTALMPGWAELGGDSVLLNGAPIATNFDRNQDGHVAWLGLGSQSKSPRPCQPVRVTGVLSIDFSHDGNPLEIHPV